MVYATITQQLVTKDWNFLNEGTLDNAYRSFEAVLNGCLDEHAPLKTKMIKATQTKRQPWITKGLLISIRTKNRLYNKCKTKPKNDPNIYVT